MSLRFLILTDVYYIVEYILNYALCLWSDYQAIVGVKHVGF